MQQLKHIIFQDLLNEPRTLKTHKLVHVHVSKDMGGQRGQKGI